MTFIITWSTYSGSTSYEKMDLSVYDCRILRPWSTHRVQTVALIDGVFVVGFQLVEDNHMKYREEDQHRVADQRDYVRNCGKVESHFCGGVCKCRQYGGISKRARSLSQKCFANICGQNISALRSGSRKRKPTQIIMTSGFMTFVHLCICRGAVTSYRRGWGCRIFASGEYCTSRTRFKALNQS